MQDKELSQLSLKLSTGSAVSPNSKRLTSPISTNAPTVTLVSKHFSASSD